MWGPVTSGGTAPAWTRPCTLAANRQQHFLPQETMKKLKRNRAIQWQYKRQARSLPSLIQTTSSRLSRQKVCHPSCQRNTNRSKNRTFQEVVLKVSEPMKLIIQVEARSRTRRVKTNAVLRRYLNHQMLDPPRALASALIARRAAGLPQCRGSVPNTSWRPISKEQRKK